MPIYLYECSVGHMTEFLKLKRREKEPKFCTHLTIGKQVITKRTEDFPCGLPLKKIIAPTNWKYTKGKNINWPLTDSTKPGEKN